MFLKELSYSDNIGVIEMVKFYQIATPSQIKEMEALVKKKDWNSFKALISRVLGVNLF